MGSLRWCVVKPSRESINRLYWLEEMSLRETADALGLSMQCIHYHMKNYGIPRRSPAPPKRSECIERGCKEPVCKVKKWKYSARGYRWIWTIRCAKHAHMDYNKRKRRDKRRRNGLSGYGRPTRGRLPLGAAFFIAKEEL